jgi:hypothetical protein
LVTLAIVAVFVPGAFAYTEEDEQEAAGSKPIIKERSITKTTKTTVQYWSCSSAKCLRPASELTSRDLSEMMF